MSCNSQQHRHCSFIVKSAQRTPHRVLTEAAALQNFLKLHQIAGIQTSVTEIVSTMRSRSSWAHGAPAQAVLCAQHVSSMHRPLCFGSRPVCGVCLFMCCHVLYCRQSSPHCTNGRGSTSSLSSCTTNRISCTFACGSNLPCGGEQSVCARPVKLGINFFIAHTFCHGK